ncbi:MAG: NAD(P)-dependent oxidoreductase [Gemmatimonadaceae bacterium]|jgi:3-hydroxyisobutyrate dehydrogenase|nr:NAD(P)-dependent oxidoreductase [Gemmatimonadaceae bacterium]
MTQHVAFLGLGAIGAPMAARLAAAGVPLTVWNRTVAKATESEAVRHGAQVAATAAAAVAGADVVITCLPESRDVVALLDADGGAVRDAFRPGTVLVDCTSGDPATSRVLAAALAARGVGFLDAPVSGGVVGAVNGTLTVMVGGDAALLERVRPVLAPFAGKVVHCGAVGAGHALKAVNNALLALHVWSTAEGLVAAQAAGVDPAVALDVINASSGRSNASMNLFPERVLTGAFPRTFRLALLDKDARIAAGVARDAQLAAPTLQLAADLMAIAHRELGEEADHVEAVRVVERWARTELRG